MELAIINTSNKSLEWERNTLHVLNQKRRNLKHINNEYVRFKLLTRMIRKVYKLENHLNHVEIEILRNKIEIFLDELENLKTPKEIRKEVKTIKKHMEETFFLIDHNYYKKYISKASVFLSPIFAFLYPNFLLGVLINLLLSFLIGVSLDLFNKQKGITI